MKKQIFFKYIIILLPKLIMVFFAFIGVIHIWYNHNYCEVNFIDDYDYFLTGNVSYNHTIIANFNQLTYFFNDTNYKIQIPNNARVNCNFYFKRPIEDK